MRLDKFLCHTGYGTRKEVKQLISSKRVKVNGQIIKKSDLKIDEFNDEIFVDESQVVYQEFIYVMLHKPAGYLSAANDARQRTVLDLVPEYDYASLFPVGRLDKDTEGLLLLTNDGELAHQLLAPKNKHPRIYYAKIDKVVNEEDIKAFKQGIQLDDGYVCMEGHLTIISSDETGSEIELEIYEGKFHQVKRMFEARGKTVTYLKRIKMKNLVLDPSLKKGKYRLLTQEEIDELKQ